MLNAQLYRIATVGWLAGIAVLSLSPVLPTAASLVSDKIEHFAAYALLSLLAILGWRHVVPAWHLALAAAVFGLLMEFLQAFAPGRSPEWLDLLANSTGAVIGLASAWAIIRLAGRQTQINR
jgi:VanZ family protein